MPPGERPDARAIDPCGGQRGGDQNNKGDDDDDEVVVLMDKDGEGRSVAMVMEVKSSGTEGGRG